MPCQPLQCHASPSGALCAAKSARLENTRAGEEPNAQGCQLRSGTRLHLGDGTTVGLFGVPCFRPDLPQWGMSSSEGRPFPGMENAGGCLPAGVDPAQLAFKASLGTLGVRW